MSVEPERPTSESAQPSLELDDAPETPDVHYMHAPIMREQAEPRDGREPVPLWLTVFYGVIVFWAGYYLATYNGGFRTDVYDETSFRLGAAAEEDQQELDPAVRGKRLFTVHCAACHQQSGQGVAGQFPPLAGSEWVVGEGAVLIRILLHGLQGPVTVLGETYNGNMPAFGQKLDDQQLALVLTYIRQTWGNQAAAITPEWIALVREKEKARTAAWTAEELQVVQPEPPPEPAAPKTDDAGKAEGEEAGGERAGDRQADAKQVDDTGEDNSDVDQGEGSQAGQGPADGEAPDSREGSTGE